MWKIDLKKCRIVQDIAGMRSDALENQVSYGISSRRTGPKPQIIQKALQPTGNGAVEHSPDPPIIYPLVI